MEKGMIFLGDLRIFPKLFHNWFRGFKGRE
jgi:hypothetical protein